MGKNPIKSRDDKKIKDKLFSKGCRNIILALLAKERRWKELEKIEDKRTVSECIDLLISLNFVRPIIDYSESPKGVKKYKLTDKGQKFAEKLKEITEIVENIIL